MNVEGGEENRWKGGRYIRMSVFTWKDHGKWIGARYQTSGSRRKYTHGLAYEFINKKRGPGVSMMDIEYGEGA